MKLVYILPVLSLISSALGLSNSIIAARQVHTPSRRAQIDVDVCAALDVDLRLDGIVLDGLPIVVGHLDVCICVSALPVFVQTNAVARLAVLILGEEEVIALITALINAAPGHETCHYPPHSTPLCSTSNPCDFHCTDGFDRSPPDSHNPTSCVCVAPHTECNGRCGYFPYGCGTAAPVTPRNVKRCDPGFDVCGVPAGRTRDWECIDTKSDLESCGGCVTSSSSTDPSHLHGNDCSAIPHVDSVSCQEGKCHVDSCLPGYRPSITADACIAVTIHVGHVKRNSRAARNLHVRRGVDVVAVAGAKVDVGDIVKVDSKGVVDVSI